MASCLCFVFSFFFSFVFISLSVLIFWLVSGLNFVISKTHLIYNSDFQPIRSKEKAEVRKSNAKQRRKTNTFFGYSHSQFWVLQIFFFFSLFGRHNNFMLDLKYFLFYPKVECAQQNWKWFFLNACVVTTSHTSFQQRKEKTFVSKNKRRFCFLHIVCAQPEW